jgi:MHS family proline/betaine transporter-like MFS transporter
LSGAATIDPIIPRPPRPASGAIQVAAATVGNALEWFDILIYGYFAQVIAAVFFPTSNQLVSMLLTFGSFGLSYVARPVGAVLLGAYADRRGRKAALTLSIQLMVMGTAVMALMPSYARVGVIAPMAIFSARLLQGFAVAGEFGSSTAFMIEHSAQRKAFFSSFQFVGQQAAKLFAAMFGFGLLSTLHGPQLQSWGWRVPFFFGLLVGPVGMYIRRKVDETPEFLATARTRTPIRETFATEKMSLVLGVGLVAGGTAATYFSIYMPTYAITQLHLPPTTGYLVAIVLAAMAIVTLPFASQVVDRFGFIRVMLPAAIVMLFSFYPVFLLITRRPSLPTLLAGLLWADFLNVIYVSALPVTMANLFPARTRVTGLSLSYNLGVTIFGGFAPAIFTWLISVMHTNTAPSFYLMATMLISIAAIVAVSRRGNA